MLEKKNSLEHYRGNEELIERLIDWMDQCERTYQPIITSFFTPAQQEVAIRLIGKQMRYVIDGGYEGAEYCRLKLFPEFCEEDHDLQITILKAKIHRKYDHITHRDVLGTLMQLGLERDVFGDIVIKEDAIYVFVSAHIASYVMNEVSRIKHSKITIEICDEMLHVQQEFIEFTSVVSSLRADAIVSACARISREKAKAMIQKGLIKINYVLLEECDRICNNNSIISIRGYGRFQFVEIVSSTKKGNFVARLRKMK